MRIALFLLPVLLLLAACKSSTTAGSNSSAAVNSDVAPAAIGEREEESVVAPVELNDEYNEYFDITRYLVDEKSIPADSIEYLRETCYIEVWRPEVKTFEDEESEEAGAYYTAMDDFSYYMYEASSYMEGFNIPGAVTHLRFLKFDVAEGKTIAIDTEKYEQSLPMLVYKKGESPLIVDIVMPSLNSRVESYLGVK